MQTLNCILLFLLVAISADKVSSLTCLSCERIAHPRFCRVVAQCEHGEVCFLNTMIGWDNSKTFTMGCTHITHPEGCNATGKGLSGSHCLECCNTNLCNNALCGEPGHPLHRGPICYNCRSRLVSEPCNILQMCQVDEVCSISQESVLSEQIYTSECISKPTPYISTMSLCLQVPCCPLHDGKLTRPCDSSPCQNNGVCVESIEGVSCNCSPGFTGQTCEREIQYNSCWDLYHTAGIRQTGVYTIVLPHSSTTLQVLCDMTTDGGGWTVFQKRFNGSVDFNKSFRTYEYGFGSLQGEFWLGLQYIHNLTHECNHTELRIDVSRANGSSGHFVFNDFYLSAAPKYTLHFDNSTFRTNDLYTNNGMAFSTYDHDNKHNCASAYHSGWWFHSCYFVNLNGVYKTPGHHSIKNEGGMLHMYFNDRVTLKTSQMMLRADTRNCY